MELFSRAEGMQASFRGSRYGTGSFARLVAAGAMALLAVMAAFALSACSANQTTSEGQADFAPVRIGTMPTEDFLPMWAAEKDGMFAEAGVSVDLLTFDSAQALSAAIAAGEVDMAMVDVPRAVKLCESGTPVIMEWITLGADASQGAFGVLAAADAPYDNLSEMAIYLQEGQGDFGKEGVGVAANTVPEYVFDKLCEDENLNPDDIPQQEVASLPERFSLAANGNLAAAALPASLLRLGEASGMKVLAEDTEGANISQSVMIATEKFAADNGEVIAKVAEAWDDAVAAIDADPGAYGLLLAEKANLNDAIAGTYPISDYPLAVVGGEFQHPAERLVEPQIMWMQDKGYTERSFNYDEATGVIEARK